MPHFFVMLLKINLVLLLFAAAYYFILRRLTFYVINRLFLAFGMLFSTIYPFIDLTEFFYRQNQKLAAFVPAINQKVVKLVPSDFITLYWPLISMVFYVGVAIMAFRLLLQFVSLYRMHQKSAPGSVGDYQVRILNESVSPFSFWQTVYVNPKLHHENELKTILAHEQIHVREWHSLDIILAELSVVFYWFNPGVWLMKKAVKENLEFITDEKILKNGVDRKVYQYSLLDVASLIPAAQIVNNFNLSDLKKRIKMMNARRSSKLMLTRYFLILPILLTITLAFTVSKKDFKIHLAPIKQALITANIIEAPMQQSNRNQVELPPFTKSSKKVSPSFVRLPGKSQDRQRQDTVKATLQTLVILPNIGVASIPAAENAIRGKVNGIMLVTTDSLVRSGNGNRLDISLFNAESTAAVATPNQKKTIVIRGYKIGTKPGDSLAHDKPDFYFNGKKISAEDLSNINANEIESVSVQKTQLIGEVRIVGKAKGVHK